MGEGPEPVQCIGRRSIVVERTDDGGAILHIYHKEIRRLASLPIDAKEAQKLAKQLQPARQSVWAAIRNAVKGAQ